MQVVDATSEHLEAFLVQPIRQVDVDEWVLGTGRKVSMSLLADVGTNSLSRALLDENGLCICLWGVTEDGHSGIGLVWLIATDEASRRGRAIHRLWREELRQMHALFPTLVALSYHRNRLHHLWLETIGFHLKRTVSLGPFGIQYAAYVRKQEASP